MNLTQLRDIAMIVAILFVVLVIGYYWVASIIESLQKKLRTKENKELPVEKQLQFTHYNPHPHAMEVDDCSIRALSAALGLSWDETFDLQIVYAKQCKAPTGSKVTMYALLGGKGFERLSLDSLDINQIELGEEAILEGKDHWTYTDGERYYDSISRKHYRYDFYWVHQKVVPVTADVEVTETPEQILPPNLRPNAQDPIIPR